MTRSIPGLNVRRTAYVKAGRNSTVRNLAAHTEIVSSCAPGRRGLGIHPGLPNLTGERSPMSKGLETTAEKSGNLTVRREGNKSRDCLTLGLYPRKRETTWSSMPNCDL